MSSRAVEPGRFLYDDQDKTTVLIYAEDTAQLAVSSPRFARCTNRRWEVRSSAGS